MNRPEVGETNQTGRLPWSTKFGYGSTELGLVAVEVSLELYLLKFYNVVLGLPAHYTGLALALAIFWDAVSDSIMGWISDRTRSPMGRRRPYFLPGGLGLAFCFVLIYSPPSLESLAFKFTYLLVGYLLLTTTMTIIGVPHIALGGEMSFDRNERTEIFGVRRLFATLGLLLGTTLPVLLVRFVGASVDPSSQTGLIRGISSVILAVPIIVTSIIALRATRGLDRSPPATRFRIVPDQGGLRAIFRAQGSVLRNPIFRPLLLTFTIAGIGRALNASTALYFHEFRLGLSEQQTIQWILVPFFTAILLSIPGWLWISRRWDKKWPAFSGLVGLTLITGVGYPLLPPDQLIGPVVIAVLGGLLAGSLVLFESLVADTVDYDELKTGTNREGLYFGAWKMTTKISRAIGLALAGVLLGWAGFNEQTGFLQPATPQRLALLFGPGVAFFFLIAALFFFRFPLTDRTHRRVQRLLRLRRLRQRAEAG